MISQNNFGGFSSIEEYLKYLWWNMHHSDDPDRQTFAVTCYLDESGTDNKSPFAVVAGLVMKRSDFLMLSVVWDSILTKHNIEPPLHMNEFGRHGRHRNLTYPERYALFSDIAKLINCHKIISLAATIDQIKFNNMMTNEIRNAMGVYGMCFLLCAFLNHKNAEISQYSRNIAFLLDEGATHWGHVLAAHREMKRQQDKLSKNLHIGSLTFDSDENISALQAADVIAWAIRRKVTGLPIGKGFQPISLILNENHVEFSWQDDNLQKIMSAFKDSFNVS